MIRLDDVTFYYGEAPVLQGLSAELPDGCITAVVGPNGSGKSTCMKLCARLLTPRAGRVLVDGADAAAFEPRAFARQVAFLPQSRPVPMITVGSLVRHGRFPYLGMTRRLRPADAEAVEQALASVGMAELRDRELRTLSGGQRQKAYLAMLIAQGAKHLLLDEPTTYLDVRHQLELMALLRRLCEQGHCVAVVLHDLARVAEDCDRALLLHEGRPLYQGPARELYASGCVERAFGVRVKPGIGFDMV